MTRSGRSSGLRKGSGLSGRLCRLSILIICIACISIVYAAGTLTVEYSGGGRVSIGSHDAASGEKVAVSGDSVDVTLTPESGYEVFSVFRNTGPEGDQKSEDMNVKGGEQTISVPVTGDNDVLQVVFFRTGETTVEEETPAQEENPENKSELDGTGESSGQWEADSEELEVGSIEDSSHSSLSANHYIKVIAAFFGVALAVAGTVWVMKKVRNISG